MSTQAETREYPMAGEYGNDCPCCERFNAILDHGDISECRDCGAIFKADYEHKVWIAPPVE